MKRGRQEKKTSSPSPKQQHHSDIEKSYGIHVPLDLTVEILSRLPVKSTVRFQCVSKLWSSLITDSIMTWSLSKPRLLVFLDRPLLKSSVFSLSGCLLSTNKEPISTEQDSNTLDSGFVIKKMYQYTRGLICYLSSYDQFVIHNPTTRQSLLLPEIKREKRWCFMDGLFGYDPVYNQYKVLCFISSVEKESVSCQIFTLGDPKKQWRNIRGFDRFISLNWSPRVCINGKIYFTVDRYVLMGFDVRSETLLDHGGIPKNQFRNMTLVNYQGKLGCIGYSDNIAEMWVMEDQTEKQEWSKISFLMYSRGPCLLEDTPSIVGVTPNGEVVIMPMVLYPAQTLWAYFYDPKKNKTIRVEFESTFKEDHKYRKDIFGVPNHVENPRSLLDSFN
ncbi:unnamed protein product [Arabis nemorensis]|uniref:F-box domain-containing protein n=1 Tax=Arabis nemorensis TaxID=586526 RepID=A0A565CVU6_9BRAS|nr:unnamed protein product [Arabis nemorensis]